MGCCFIHNLDVATGVNFSWKDIASGYLEQGAFLSHNFWFQSLISIYTNCVWCGVIINTLVYIYFPFDDMFTERSIVRVFPWTGTCLPRLHNYYFQWIEYLKKWLFWNWNSAIRVKIIQYVILQSIKSFHLIGMLQMFLSIENKH